MIEYHCKPVFYMTVLKIFNGDYGWVNTREVLNIITAPATKRRIEHTF